MEVIFTSERIDYIRPIMELVPEYFELINNTEVSQYISLNPRVFTYEQEVEWVQQHQADYQFSMINRENHEFIGNLGINEINGDSAEIGIIISPHYQNNHYGQESITRLVEYCFSELGLREVDLIAFSYNERAINCYLRVGFEIYQTVPNVGMADGEIVDDVYMRILNNH